MGLTIGYKLFTPRRLSLGRVKQLTLRLQAKAKALGFATVGRLVAIGPDYPGPYHWPRHHRTIADVKPPVEGWVFNATPGDGSESAEIGLCRYRGLAGWRLSSWCMTQYASRHGWEHFRDCHQRVVDLLRACEQEGLTVKVQDEGRLWSMRHDWYLYRAITRYDREIAAFGGLLKAAAECVGERVHGPIFDDPRFERLEAEGHAELDSKTIEALHHLPLP